MVNTRDIFLVCCFGLLGFARAQQDETVCYAPCGCFTDGPPYVGRPLPESPWEQEIIWQLYTRNNRNIPDSMSIPFNGSQIEIPPNFNIALPTKFLFHGWGSNPDGIFSDIKDDLLNRDDLNVVLVDWRVGGGRVYYPAAASNARAAGACSTYVARTLHQGQLDNVHCIGHSLGGQTCGYMGEYSEGRLGRISGLDPAGPWFSTNETEVHLDASDAQFVDVIHTNIDGFFPLGLGKTIGHVDFYPNKGGNQPGCPPVGSNCDHAQAVYFYQESIRSGTADCKFLAKPCVSEEDADNCQCEECTEGVDCQVMGYESNLYPVPAPGEGSFFLRTTEDRPYCEAPGTGPCLE